MHFKIEIQKLIDNCKELGFLCVPDSLIFNLLYLARFEHGRPLVKYVYELVELGFNLFKHDNNPELLIMMKNIIAVCDKELATLNINNDNVSNKNENKKKN